MSLQVHNSLTKRKEAFEPIEPGKVRMYNCGPTVYGRAHIGNLRSFLFADILRRWLEHEGYEVTQVMNITDVGHITADADEGEDKLVAQAKKEGRDPWKISEQLCDGLRHLFRESGTPAIVQNVGPMFQILYTSRETIRDYRDFCSAVDRQAYQKLALALFRHGVYMSPSAALHSVASLAHTDEDVTMTLQAIGGILGDVGI